MKWLAIILLSASSLCAEITDDELRQISKEDIVLTIRHLRSLTAEAVASADRAITSETAVQARLNSAGDARFCSSDQPTIRACKALAQ